MSGSMSPAGEIAQEARDRAATRDSLALFFISAANPRWDMESRYLLAIAPAAIIAAITVTAILVTVLLAALGVAYGVMVYSIKQRT